MTDYTPEDYIKYRIERAKGTITEIQKHIENKFWNTALHNGAKVSESLLQCALL
jgi:hypothetical protein